MRTSEIKVGEEYAWKPYAWGQPYRVVVKETRVERVVSRNPYSGAVRRKVKDGVRVVTLSSVPGAAMAEETRVVPSREIVEPWLEFSTREDEILKARKASEEFRRARAEEIIRDMRRIDDALQTAGVEAVKRQLWLKKDADLLRKYYSVVEDDTRLFTITTAIPRPDRVISKGVIDLSVVLTLMDRLNL